MPFTGPVEDRLAIRELNETYADAVNQHNAEDWASTWAEDSFWCLPHVPGLEKLSGKQTIVDAWVAAMKHYPDIVFLVLPGFIKVDGDQATARMYTAESYTDSDGVARRTHGQYDDILVKIDGRWAFKSRTFSVRYWV